MKTIWKSLCRRLLPLFLLGLLLCFSSSAQAQGDSNQDWPPERLLRWHAQITPENTIPDREHYILIHREDRSEITNGASWSRVPGRDSFDPPNFYQNTDLTQSLSVSETYLGSRGVEYCYSPRSTPRQNCWASINLSVASDSISAGVVQIQLAGLNGSLQIQWSTCYDTYGAPVHFIEGNTPYAKQVAFLGYEMMCGNVCTTVQDIYQFDSIANGLFI